MEWYYVSGLTFLAQGIIVSLVSICYGIYYKIDSWKNPLPEFDEVTVLDKRAEEYKQGWLNFQEKLAEFNEKAIAENQEFLD